MDDWEKAAMKIRAPRLKKKAPARAPKTNVKTKPKKVVKDVLVNFRVNPEDLDLIKGRAKKSGFKNLSRWLREASMKYDPKSSS